MNLSYWEFDSFFHNPDLIIVGSGIVGLSTAIEAKQTNPNWKIVVLERGPLPSGASTKNAGFACFGSPSELLDDLEIMTKDEVLSLVEKRWKGLLNLRRLLGDDQIGYVPSGGFEMFTSRDDELYEKCASQLDNLNNDLRDIFGEQVFRYSDELIESMGFDGVKHMIQNTFEGQINTGKMAVSLYRMAIELDIHVINGIEVTSIAPDGQRPKVKCADFELKCERLVIATNGFARQLFPELGVEPARAQVLITKPLSKLPFKGTFHYDRGYFYFRDIDNRVLFGGGRNLDKKNETTFDMNTSELIQNELDRILSEVILPDTPFEIDRRWSGIMGVGKKKTVVMKRISDRVLTAVRLGGMGVAIGSLIGKEAATLISE